MAIYNFTKASLQPSLAGGCCWCLTLSSSVQWGTPWSVTWWLSECVRGFTLNIQLRARRQWPLSCTSLYGFQCQPGSLVPVHFHFHHTTDCVHCRCVSQLLGVPLFLVFCRYKSAINWAGLHSTLLTFYQSQSVARGSSAVLCLSQEKKLCHYSKIVVMKCGQNCLNAAIMRY